MYNFMDENNSTGKTDSQEFNKQANLDDDQVEIVDLEGEQPALPPVLLSRARLQSLQKSTRTRIMMVLLLVSAIALLLVVQPGWSSLFKTSEIDTIPPSDILQTFPANTMIYLNLVDGTLQARKANDGTLQWSKKQLPEYNKRFLATTESVVYSASSQPGTGGVIEAFRATDGRRLWKYETTALASYALIAHGTMLYVHTIKGLLLALDGRNGHLLWQFFLGPYQPLDFSLHAGEGVVALSTNNEDIHVLRAENGSEILTYKQTYNWQFAAEKGIIYINKPGLRLEAIRIKDGSLAWRYPAYLPDEFQIMSASYIQLFWQIKDGIIYVDAGSGVLEALRAEDGKSLWQYNLKYSPLVGENSYSILANGGSLRLFDLAYAVQDNLICISDDMGKFVLLQANDGTLLWHNNFRALENRPQIAGDILFFGSDRYSIDVWLISKKRHLWGYTTSTTIYADPKVDNGNMYLLSVNSGEGLKLDVLQLASGAILWRYPTIARTS